MRPFHKTAGPHDPGAVVDHYSSSLPMSGLKNEMVETSPVDVSMHYQSLVVSEACRLAVLDSCSLCLPKSAQRADPIEMPLVDFSWRFGVPDVAGADPLILAAAVLVVSAAVVGAVVVSGPPLTRGVTSLPHSGQLVSRSPWCPISRHPIWVSSHLSRLTGSGSIEMIGGR